ncbi:protein FAR1-RELATED SEQUENCE 5-like [Salvia miltiorrhiza]|uniref:protein FAR1-RELATED SEQUENCE 5-like n=1 Tax=Salvia miltiorrhiza TaxID=226208 RepID=UPI0025ACFF10|nr:protein FAR1-RELATED SEQUENCE 5-like [Salvia miltiorrhiza]
MEENVNNDEFYIPQVTEERIPKAGMKFLSVEAAFSFYNQYAREAGFSARISNSKKNKVTNEIFWKQIVCFNKKVIQISRVLINGSPSKVHLLRSHRSVSIAKRALTQQFSKANVPTCQQMRLLEIEYGGPGHVGCTERDIRNIEQELRDEQKGVDAETLIEFFASEKDKNPTFFFDYETDSNKMFRRCFWADPKSMSDEKTESFIWLLKKWMEAMPTGAPKVIITDQDPAMTKAIAQVLPFTVHRYCLWHILTKFPDKVSPVTLRDHYQNIKKVIMNSTSPDEFEQSWKYVIKCANLELNDWISLILVECRGMCHALRSWSSSSVPTPLSGISRQSIDNKEHKSRASEEEYSTSRFVAAGEGDE